MNKLIKLLTVPAVIICIVGWGNIEHDKHQYFYTEQMRRDIKTSSFLGQAALFYKEYAMLKEKDN
ncbi:hypothetical protein [Lysinibacillus piscis]|uniref:Uncharacterized protein n=1 Tax=Lysinibacillus piscis TaxID=2518931 RepID=A0ABQ5NES3_9BACI|nr:hypothetical protein [Lysinibacillus sp. KH24]GLC86892.1 hypothetical protein LYSBPC_00190 [Lysinibacillus sp. KH24]